MSDIQPIYIPRDSVSDDAYLVVEFAVENGASVEEGEVIAVLETSKATFDLEAPASGRVHFGPYTAGQHVQVGAVFAALAGEGVSVPDGFFEVKTEKASRAPAPKTATAGVRFSEKARALMEEHRVDPSVFDEHGLVRARDVAAYVSRNTSPAKKPSHVNGSSPADSGEPMLILGGGGHGKMLIDLLRQHGGYAPAAIADARYPMDDVLGVPVVCGDSYEEVAAVAGDGIRYAAHGIGMVTDHARRHEPFERLRRAGFMLPNLIHPKAAVEPSAEMGEGNQILALAVVGSDVVMGDSCIINSGVVVSHDCRLGTNVHLAPGALLAGGVEVGDHTLVGMGVTVYLGVRIGRNVVIHNGARVVRDVPDGAVIKP